MNRFVKLLIVGWVLVAGVVTRDVYANRPVQVETVASQTVLTLAEVLGVEVLSSAYRVDLCSINRLRI